MSGESSFFIENVMPLDYIVGRVYLEVCHVFGWFVWTV